MAVRSAFHAAYLRWLLPIIVLLIMATLLILGPALFTHATGTKNTTPTSRPAITSPATPTQSSPNVYWFN